MSIRMVHKAAELWYCLDFIKGGVSIFYVMHYNTRPTGCKIQKDRFPEHCDCLSNHIKLLATTILAEVQI